MQEPIVIPRLIGDTDFPDISTALNDPDGLLAWGGNLNSNRLIDAYSKGIFPWHNPDEPLLWWCPSERMVLQFKHLHISHSMKKIIKKMQREKNHPLTIRLDTCFEHVMRSCAQKRRHQEGTWISEDFIQSYSELHRLGLAHSVETWHNNTLVGGLYGVSIGKMFFGESMFSKENNTSKLALIFLMYYLAKQGVLLIDCQQNTAHLNSMGGECMSREAFSNYLSHTIEQDHIVWRQGCLSPHLITLSPT